MVVVAEGGVLYIYTLGTRRKNCFKLADKVPPIHSLLKGRYRGSVLCGNEITVWAFLSPSGSIGRGYSNVFVAKSDHIRVAV